MRGVRANPVDPADPNAITRFVSGRIEVELIARDLSQGLSLEAIQEKRNLTQAQLRRRLAILKARYQDKYGGEADPAEVMGNHIGAVTAQIRYLEALKERHTVGPPRSKTITRVTRDAAGDTVTESEAAPARDGITPGDYIRACQTIAQGFKSIIEVGQSLGVYPQVESTPVVGTPSLQMNFFTHIVNAVRRGDMAAVERYASGAFSDVSAIPPGSIIDAPATFPTKG